MRWLGAALMFYPYLTRPTWLLYGAGIALCAVDLVGSAAPRLSGGPAFRPAG